MWCWALAALAGLVLAGTFEAIWFRVFGMSKIRMYIEGVLFLLVICSYTFGVSFLSWQYWSLLNAMHSRSFQEIEGVVTNSIPGAPRTRGQIERFTVNGREFKYAPYEIGPGFRQPLGDGNPIRKGEYIRIGSVGATIIRVEVCDRGNAAPGSMAK
jgi:hypothetical protein